MPAAPIHDYFLQSGARSAQKERLRIFARASLHFYNISFMKNPHTADQQSQAAQPQIIWSFLRRPRTYFAPPNITTGANSTNIFAADCSNGSPDVLKHIPPPPSSSSSDVPANTGSGVAVGGTTVAVGGSVGGLSTDGTQRHRVRHGARLLLVDTFEVANGASEMDRAQDVITPV